MVTIALRFKKAVPILLLALICYGLGNAWTILPAISHTILKESHGFLSGHEYASLAFFLVLGAILASQGATEIGRFYGVKIALIGGMAGVFLGTLGLAGAPFASLLGGDYRYAFFIASQFFIGVGIGAILTSVNAFLVLYMFNRTATFLVAMYACINFGSFSAPFLLGTMFQEWWVFPLLLACYFFLLALAVIGWLPRVHNPNALARQPLKVIFKKLPPLFWLFVGAVFLYAVCEDCLISWTTIFFHLEKGLVAKEATEGLALFWAVVAVTQLVISGLVNKISPRPIYRLLPCFLVLGLLGMIVSKPVGLYLAFFAVAGLGVSAFFSLSVNFAEKQFHQVAEFISGMLVFSYLLGTVVGSLGIGFLYQTLHWKLEEIFIAICIMAILLVPLNFFVTKSTYSND